MKSIKGFISGMIAMLVIISLIGTVFAEPVRQTINAVFMDIKIAIDGERLDPEDIRDVNGNIVAPFVIGGTTYIPLRAFAEAVGYEVGWDTETDTVLLNRKPGPILIILNTSSKVYHKSEICMAVGNILGQNREDITVNDISEIPEEYTPCGICVR
jgi:hypothetical protein